MVDLPPDDRRLLMTRLSAVIGAVDVALVYSDDEELAAFRGQCVRLYLDLMDMALRPFDQQQH